MNLKLSALKTNVIKTFIIVTFVSFAVLNENYLLLKVNKMFVRLFFIEGFFELDFLCEIMTIMIQFMNLIREAFYILMLHR